ncbi:hypothetical protein [Deinococcus maricopensis]|uniref:Uncharacterized protein n=1 Tax=Deinococcus maricopensis (strain DSM 21211 / LMG 22137 / NRRL B-23946 / LB-34) TaxID=709986 RepID=E8U4U5_DEIML|nr:hypothetical protein [Deinococcus maricopensis]ADV66084.1 hypothetical protein Deima_0424 [Deinococcus maricopensis DSM 21211]
MTNPQAFTAHFGDTAVPGEIQALEGRGGYMRVHLRAGSVPTAEGTPCELEMHDGARFRMVITEDLGDAGPGARNVRLKLVGRGE